MGRRTYRWWASAVVAAVAGFVRNCRKEERFLSGEQVGGSMPGVPVVTTAQRSGRSRRTGANAMSLVFYLHISACRCERQSTVRGAVHAVRDRAGTAGGSSPLSSLFHRRACEQGTLLPPISRSSRHACLSSQRHLSLMLRCPLGMLGRSRRVWPTASLLL